MASGTARQGHSGPRGTDVDGGRVALVNWNGYRHFNRDGTMLRRLTGYEPHLDWCRTRQRSDMLGIVARTLLAKILPGI